MINGRILKEAMISAANHLGNHRAEVDSLNVFPVPDGDTGTNMGMTFSAAVRELSQLGDAESVEKVSATAASALLRGARGNSGVITSLLFRGYAKGFKGKENATAEDFVTALEIGVASAYKAVMKPTEGTMLTVARMSAEAARAALTESMTISALWQIVVQEAKAALALTPEMLPVLKKAGVVDAGGQGLVYIYEGMAAVFDGGEVIDSAAPEETPGASIHPDRNAAGELLEDIHFTYCTEFIVYDRDQQKDPLELRGYLETIGDCVVVVDDEDIIKCHVHTNNPGNALQKALEFGPLTKLKIENMREQHETAAAANRQADAAVEAVSAPQAEERIHADNGFVAIAAGDGVRDLFLDLGVQVVVEGGQTMNPSTDDILHAIERLDCPNIYVLPNNKNIIMAAEQAAKLTRSNVHVVPTKTIPQGLSAMLAFDPSAECGDNALAMLKASESVGTGQITFAARDSDYEGKTIHKGELLALENGKVSFTEHDMAKAAVRLVKALCKKDTSYVTLIYGADIAKQDAEQVEEAVRQKLPKDAELSLVYGGQPVYYYIISVE